MKNKLSAIISYCFIFYILLLYSCQGNIEKAKEMDSIVFDMSTVPVDEESISFSDCDIIPLEKNDKCMIGRVDKLHITPKGIYILDKKLSHTIHLFDHSGKYIRKIGRQGHAKNEYVKINNFTVSPDGDSVYVIDFDKVTSYTSGNKFISTYKLDDEYGWDDFACIDNSFYMVSYHHGYDAILTQYTNDFSKKKKIGNIDNSLVVGAACSHSFIQYNDKYICFWDYLKSTIYIIDRIKQCPIKKYVVKLKSASDKTSKKQSVMTQDEIFNLRLVDDHIFAFISDCGYISSFVLDIKNDSISKQESHSLFCEMKGYYDGYLYLHFCAENIASFSKHNIFGISEYINKKQINLSADDNIYIVRMKVHFKSQDGRTLQEGDCKGTKETKIQ